ncbi:MAG: hypothetical protein AAGU11_04335, partial [Syntrophobacteraceae bacterium]
TAAEDHPPLFCLARQSFMPPGSPGGIKQAVFLQVTWHEGSGSVLLGLVGTIKPCHLHYTLVQQS